MAAITPNYSGHTGAGTADTFYDNKQINSTQTCSYDGWSDNYHVRSPAKRKKAVTSIPIDPPEIIEYWSDHEGVGRSQQSASAFRLSCRRARNRQWTGRNFRRFK